MKGTREYNTSEDFEIGDEVTITGRGYSHIPEMDSYVGRKAVIISKNSHTVHLKGGAGFNWSYNAIEKNSSHTYKTGDKVRIAREGEYWDDGMDEYIGLETEITTIGKCNTVRVRNGHGYWFHVECLDRIPDKKEEIMSTSQDLKVGDRVRVDHDGSQYNDTEEYANTWCDPTMTDQIGDVFTLRSIDSYGVKLEGDKSGLNWPIQCLVKVVDECAVTSWYPIDVPITVPTNKKLLLV